MAVAPKRAPRLALEDRRSQILGCTTALVAREGFGALTIDAVAREAGITRPVVYDSFGDLGGLIEAFLADADERAMAAAGGAIPDPESDAAPDALLESAFRTFLEAVHSDPDLWRIILIPPEGMPPEARGRVDERRGELAREVTARLASILDRNALLESADREVIAYTLIGIAEDMGRTLLRNPKRFGPERIAVAAGQLARLLPAGGSS